MPRVLHLGPAPGRVFYRSYATNDGFTGAYVSRGSLQAMIPARRGTRRAMTAVPHEVARLEVARAPVRVSLWPLLIARFVERQDGVSCDLLVVLHCCTFRVLHSQNENATGCYSVLSVAALQIISELLRAGGNARFLLWRGSLTTPTVEVPAKRRTSPARPTTRHPRQLRGRARCPVPSRAQRAGG